MVSPAQSQLIDAAIQPLQTGSDIAYAVAAKALQAQRQQGAAVVQLLESADPESTTPQPGDSLVAQATGLGGLLDTTA